MHTCGCLSEKKLAEAIDIAKQYEYSLIKAALNFGLLSRKEYTEFLLTDGITHITLEDEDITTTYISQCDIHCLLAYLFLPVRKNASGKLIIAAADPFDSRLQDIIAEKFNCETEICAASDLDITKMIHRYTGCEYINESVLGLAKKDLQSSALRTFTFSQLVFTFLFISLTFTGFVYFFEQTLIIAEVLLSIFFLFSILFKLLLVTKGAQHELANQVTKSELQNIIDVELPVYTILLPVYKEDKVIRKLIRNLRALDYPKHLLDIKLLIEEDDIKTFEAVRNLDFAANVEVIIVPHRIPKTKPKACNYGLFFSKGKYLTIYDAEDIPDHDQLKKAICLFQKLPENFIVLQSELNYFNKNENLLTRMFTLEYSYWFDYMLPGLQAFNIPIPLGGTSNHFKIKQLIELGAWDPFNVTEDADLGVRVFSKGFKVGLINSTTFEEANNHTANWIRQRSRWIKGYMQTFLVYLRDPRALIKKIGWKGFLGFTFFIGATPFTFLIYPLLLLFSLLQYLLPGLTSGSTHYNWLNSLSVFNMIAGHVMMINVNMMAVFKRKYYELLPYALLNPLYWILHSIAAYKALWQLFIKPFYWEKTEHGLTQMSLSANISNAVK